MWERQVLRRDVKEQTESVIKVVSLKKAIGFGTALCDIEKVEEEQMLYMFITRHQVRKRGTGLCILLIVKGKNLRKGDGKPERCLRSVVQW